jgi:hypothetical protein
MRMVERRSHLRFALETPTRVGIQQIIRQKLDRNRTIEFRIGGSTHDAHAALPEQCIDSVAADERANSDRAARSAYRGIVSAC